MIFMSSAKGSNFLPEDVLTKRGAFHFVFCATEDRSVLNSDLSEEVFEARMGEGVKLFQDWQSGFSTQQLDNEKTYVKVEFLERDSEAQNIGWVRKDFIKLESDCHLLKDSYRVTETDFRSIPFFDLNDSDCCNFPTHKRPTTSYLEGMRRFGAGRSGGSRLHAACDLYRTKDEAIYSVAPGTVQLGLYEFYMGTYAIEVKHEGGFVVRYGEVTGKRVSNVSTGKKVSKGQHLGYMAQIRMKNCCEPMLHFELYSGKAKGSLSGGGSYRRRSDLMNPSSHLQKWEKLKFGESY